MPRKKKRDDKKIARHNKKVARKTKKNPRWSVKKEGKRRARKAMKKGAY